MDLTKVLIAAGGNNNTERLNAEGLLLKLQESNLVTQLLTKANVFSKSCCRISRWK